MTADGAKQVTSFCPSRILWLHPLDLAGPGSPSIGVASSAGSRVVGAGVVDLGGGDHSRELEQTGALGCQDRCCRRCRGRDFARGGVAKGPKLSAVVLLRLVGRRWGGCRGRPATPRFHR